MMISYLVLLVFLSVSIGFFSVLERKVLGYMQIRVGPVKVGVKGLMQPFADGGKLFMKEYMKLSFGDLLIFMMAPLLGMSLCFLLWSLYIYEVEWLDFDLGVLVFICISSVGVYVVIFSGWSSNSTYGMIGSYRVVAQSISYEVVMALLILGILSVIESYSMMKFGEMDCHFLWLGSGSFLMWMSVLLVETNRSPYDFAEGESELVSGFNVEYSSIGFSLLFMAEYGNIMFMCYLSGIMIWGKGFILSGVWFSMLSFMVIWVRGSLPRTRYDKLMNMAWKGYLSLTLGMFIFLGSLSLSGEVLSV